VESTFKPGTLWQSVVDVTERALSTGALLPIPTNFDFIDDCGVRFLVRVLSSLERKDAERRIQQAQAPPSGKKANPFLPYERDLFVADVSETHVALLNKFNVVDHHLLIVTRRFEHQETLLTLQDFEALWTCMAEYRALGFYNGGEAAGASQEHKHLQMVPLPLVPVGPEVPIDPLLTTVSRGDDIGRVKGLPFLNAFARIEKSPSTPPEYFAARTFDLFCRMLVQTGLKAPQPGDLERQSAPYCLLVTPEWMLLVPRSREHFEDISLNSLAYAGSFFVWDNKQLERLREFGPINALRTVSMPAEK
jgi:ATP adenylyltransferase